jgi:hypothetical protein
MRELLGTSYRSNWAECRITFCHEFSLAGFCCLLWKDERSEVDKTTRLLGISLLPREGIALVASPRATRFLGKFVIAAFSNARL